MPCGTGGAAPRRSGLRREHRHGRAGRRPPHRARAARAPAQPAAGPGDRRARPGWTRPTRGRSSRSGCARSCPATPACPPRCAGGWPDFLDVRRRPGRAAYRGGQRGRDHAAGSRVRARWSGSARCSGRGGRTRPPARRCATGPGGVRARPEGRARAAGGGAGRDRAVPCAAGRGRRPGGRDGVGGGAVDRRGRRTPRPVRCRVRARRRHPGRRARAAPRGSRACSEPRSLQAPVSFRVAGPVLAHVLRAADALAAAIERALTGVTDSPAFLDGTVRRAPPGSTASTLPRTATSSPRRSRTQPRSRRRACTGCSTPRVTGLPAQLAARPGPDAGLVAVHKRAAGEVHAMRRLAVRRRSGSIETSGGQEDVQSFAWEAAEALRAALHHARSGHRVRAAGRVPGLLAVPRTAPDGLPRRARPAGRDRGPDRRADRPFGEDIERILGAGRLAARETRRVSDAGPRAGSGTSAAGGIMGEGCPLRQAFRAWPVRTESATGARPETPRH